MPVKAVHGTRGACTITLTLTKTVHGGSHRWKRYIDFFEAATINAERKSGKRTFLRVGFIGKRTSNQKK